MENVSILKDKKNGDGDACYINKQLPEKIMEQNHEIRQKIKDLKLKEDKLPPKDITKIEVRNKIVFFDGEAREKKLLLPEPKELCPDTTE